MELKVQKERVLKAAEKCSTAKGILQELFPEVFEGETLKITHYPTPGLGEIRINNLWVGTLIDQSEEGVGCSKKFLNKQASLFLTTCNGLWYDENGNIISSYLFFVPNKVTIDEHIK
jgi:hypothetical protein